MAGGIGPGVGTAVGVGAGVDTARQGPEGQLRGQRQAKQSPRGPHGALQKANAGAQRLKDVGETLLVSEEMLGDALEDVWKTLVFVGKPFGRRCFI